MSKCSGTWISKPTTDIVVVDKENQRPLPIDIALPADTTVDEKEQENVDKYQDRGTGAWLEDSEREKAVH